MVQRIVVGGAEKRQSAMSSLRASATTIVARAGTAIGSAGLVPPRQLQGVSAAEVFIALFTWDCTNRRGGTASVNFHGADVDTVAFVRGVPWVRGSLSRFPA